MIYAIQAASGPIKIGIAKSPKRRLSTLQTASHEPLALLGASITTWDEEVEKLLHGWCDAHHIRGEWFKPEGAVLAAVQAIRDGGAEYFATRRKAAILLARNPDKQHLVDDLKRSDESVRAKTLSAHA